MYRSSKSPRSEATVDLGVQPQVPEDLADHPVVVVEPQVVLDLVLVVAGQQLLERQLAPEAQVGLVLAQLALVVPGRLVLHNELGELLGRHGARGGWVAAGAG
ncbi:uncharacterized protein PG986_000179 [Apiospora aurea]|uniref:Uncharacterized protein n=1 Tax=Apiospora aurea TaxID=335848 RepID=A0ABR1QT97_9PEZI